MGIEALIEEIKDCAKEVRSQLTTGFEENVYKNAMFLELKDRGLSVQTEIPLKVMYKGREVGNYRADMIVEDRVIVELKAIAALTTMHEVQLVNYLTATGIDDGLLINFGADRIQIQRKFRLYDRIKLSRQSL
ncbi:MAG: GxxExxY protein [Prevotella sp.]|nr:GxxExxY protein [Prevotella sp.]